MSAIESEGTARTAGEAACSGEGSTTEMECRICMVPDEVRNLVEPCSCKGSAQYAHHTCVQKWILTDRSSVLGSTSRQPREPKCEVCGQPWRGDFKLPAPKKRRTPGEELEIIKMAIASAWLRVETRVARPQDDALLTRVAPLVPGPWDEWVRDYLAKKERQQRWQDKKDAIRSLFSGGHRNSANR